MPRNQNHRRPRSQRASEHDPDRLSPQSRRALFLLAVTVFIDMLGFGIILPNLPHYIEMAVGANHRNAAAIAGLLAASYSFTQFVFAPFWGRYSDRAGRRPVILISLIGIAVSYTLFGLAGSRLWVLFAARLLAGLLSSASIGVSFAYVADVTTPENRARGIGLLGACFGLGFAFGPVAGGLLSKINVALPAFVAAGMALANFIASYFNLPESLSNEERAHLAGQGREPYPAVMRRVLRDPAAPMFLITFVLTFGFTALEQVFGFYLMAQGIADKGNQQERMAYILGVIGVLGIIIQGGLMGSLVRRLGEGNVIRLGLVTLTVGYLLLTLPTSWGILIFVAALFTGGGRSLIGPAASALISRKTKVGQGLIQSSSQGFDALARTVGPVTAGFLFQQFGALAPYYVAAALTIGALALTYLIRGAVTLPPNAPAVEEAEDSPPVTSSVEVPPIGAQG